MQVKLDNNFMSMRVKISWRMLTSQLTLTSAKPALVHRTNPVSV